MTRGDGLAGPDGTAHRRDGRRILLAIALGIGARQRGLTQHVEGIAVVALFLAGGAGQRGVDVAPHDELVPEDAHGLLERRARHGLTESGSELAVPGARFSHLVAIQRHDATGEHQSPGGCVDQQRIAVAEMVVPGAARNLVGDEPVGGLAIRDSQQGFGEAHEDHAFA